MKTIEPFSPVKSLFIFLFSIFNFQFSLVINNFSFKSLTLPRFSLPNLSLSILILLSLTLQSFSQNTGPESAPTLTPWVLIIHGGAGGPPKGTYSPEREQQYREKMTEALQAGAAILRNNGSSLDAVEAAIRVMEDSPLFNAAKGAVLNEEGKAELDASIMDGKTLMAGAVAGVKTIKNPISAARKVMTNSPHVLLIGGGAEKFAKEQNLEIVDPSYFITKERLDQWEKAKRKADSLKKAQEQHGTVGAVALDQSGNLAAGTSTGGMMMKKWGRVGDSPIIGAGTYANNKTCAISCTGHGEYFIRNVVAYDISALMEYKEITLMDASNYEILDKLKSQGADGGLIGVDSKGNIAMPFNTNAMFRGYIKSDGTMIVEIY